MPAPKKKKNKSLSGPFCRTPREVGLFAKEHHIEIVDLKYIDIFGAWQHFSIPVSDLTDFKSVDSSLWAEGIGIDGSSIQGFQEIHESDILLIPDPSTVRLDPICKHPTLSVICDIREPATGQSYSRDPRFIAKKAEDYLKKTKIADTSYWGPEAEFFIFDDIRYGQNENSGFYFLDSSEGNWNAGRDERPNLGYKQKNKGGYCPVAPHDTLQDIRTEIMLTLRGIGIPVEVHHHEVATAGQCEIAIRYSPLVEMADNLMMSKYVIKNIARKNNKVATFMPKPIFMDNGSGMHCHQSLWKNGRPLFYDATGYASISQLCKWYLGGLLKHTASLLAFAAPTTNSYKRLVPGFEAPVNLAYSASNRSAACRIPMYSSHPGAKRIEFRPPDPLCNPYLTFAAMLMAGLDGIQNKIDPGEPIDENIYELDEKKMEKVKHAPKSLEEALNALEADHGYLLKGGVFTQDVINTWLKLKRTIDIDQVRQRPHPWEFHLYFDQ